MLNQDDLSFALLKPTKCNMMIREELGFEATLRFDDGGFIIMPTDVNKKIGWGENLKTAIAHCKERNSNGSNA